LDLPDERERKTQFEQDTQIALIGSLEASAENSRSGPHLLVLFINVPLSL
jgi:hypothetical protein